MDAKPLEPPYWLSRHAYTCVCGERLVILDLASGDYLGLRAEDARPLGAWIRGWPLSTHEECEPKALRHLLEAGLLTTKPAQGRPDASPAKVAEPIGLLADRLPARSVAIRPHHIGRFLLATATVFVTRRFRLKHIVAYIRRRKERRRARAFDLAKTADLIAVFQSLSPWFFGNQDQCFRNSLILLQFLAHYGVFPEWIFAVRGDPFSAHCWLQQEGLVLNDNFVATATLTPIMVI